MSSFTSARLKTIETSWREYRSYTPKQCRASDFLTNQGIFSLAPKKQTYCFYGGAGYGGKSYWLRSMAFELCLVLRDLGFPNLWGSLFCLTYPDLRERHIEKFETEFEGIGTLQETSKHGWHVKWHGEGLGGLHLRNVASSEGAKKGKGTKRGSENAFVLLEEATEMDATQIGKIMYTARLGLPLPFFARALASNPDGPGHRYCKDIFHPEHRDLHHELFKTVDPSCFYFVQAFRHDNPTYAANKEVIDTAMQMETDPEIRKARMEGSWDLYLSGRFPSFSREFNGFEWDDLFEFYGIPEGVSPEEFLLECQRWGFDIYGSLDYGTSATSLSAYYLHLIGPDNRIWTFDELLMAGMQLPDQADRIIKFETINGVRLRIRNRYADPYLNGKVAEDQSGLTRADKFLKHGLTFIMGINDRVEGAASVESALYFRKGEDKKPISMPMWRINRSSCPELLRQIPNLPRDPNNPEDVDKSDGQWHCYDSVRYLIHTRVRGGVAQIDRPEWMSPAWVNRVAKQENARRQRFPSRRR